MKIRITHGIHIGRIVDARYVDDARVEVDEIGYISLGEFVILDWENSVCSLLTLRPGEHLRLNLTLSEVRLIWETELSESHQEKYELVTEKSNGGVVVYIEPWRDGSFRETVIFCSIAIIIIGAVSWLIS